jgi:hypothetical protein
MRSSATRCFVLSIGALAALSLACIEAHAQTCEEAYGGVATTAEAGALRCTRRLDETVNTSRGAVHVSVWVREPAPAAVDMVVAAMRDTMRRALPVYAGYRPLPMTIVSIVGRDALDWMHGEDLGVEGVAGYEQRSNRCVVDMAIGAHRAGMRGATPSEAGMELNWAIAHELFHCVQWANFPQTDRTDHIWWVEGEAEYFPSFVLDPALSGFRASFDGESEIHSVFDVGPAPGGYANVELLTGIAGRSSARYLLDVFSRLPASENHAAQAARLSTDGVFVADFHSFAEDYFSGEIPAHLPNHVSLPTNPQFGPARTVAANIDLGFAPDYAVLTPIADEADARREAMRLYRGHIVFAPRHRYRIDAMGGGHIALLPEGYEWMENPSAAMIDACEDPVAALAVADIVDPHSPFAPRLRIQVEPPAPGVCGRRDPCLVGRWRVDQAHMDRITAGLGASAAARTERGPIEIVFAASGAWAIQFHHLMVRWQSPLGASRMVFEGEGQGRWAAPHDGSLISSVSSDTSYERVYVSNGGRQAAPMRLPAVVSGFGLSNAPEAYQCTADTLTFTQPTGDIVYHRVSRDPGYPRHADFRWAH